MLSDNELSGSGAYLGRGPRAGRCESLKCGVVSLSGRNGRIHVDQTCSDAVAGHMWRRFLDVAVSATLKSQAETGGDHSSAALILVPGGGPSIHPGESALEDVEWDSGA